MIKQNFVLVWQFGFAIHKHGMSTHSIIQVAQSEQSVKYTASSSCWFLQSMVVQCATSTGCHNCLSFERVIPCADTRLLGTAYGIAVLFFFCPHRNAATVTGIWTYKQIQRSVVNYGQLSNYTYSPFRREQTMLRKLETSLTARFCNQKNSVPPIKERYRCASCNSM